MLQLRGLYTALITPMKNSFDVDYDGFKKLVQLQIAAGVQGLVPVATTGESPSLDEHEWEELVKIAVQEAGKSKNRKVAVIAGCGTNSTRTTVERTKKAKALGADAALVVVPYYNKPNDDGLFSHFSAAANLDIPVIIYNVPGRTSRPLNSKLIENLSEIKNIIGIKESSESVGLAAEIIWRCVINRRAELHKFTVLSGDDGLVLPTIALGAEGLVSVVSNLVPERMAALVDACLEGAYKKARGLYFDLHPLFKTAFLETNPIPIKRAMSIAGLPAGPARLPLGELSSENEKLIRAELTRLRI